MIRVPFLRDRSGLYAVTDTNHPGPCVITWYRAGDPDVQGQCDGWVAGDILFAPAVGADRVGVSFLGRDQRAGTVFDDLEWEGFALLPDPRARWYDVVTGRDAIVALPGSPLSIVAS